MEEFATEHHLAWMDVIFFVVVEVIIHKNQLSKKDANANFVGVVSLNAKLVSKA